MSGLSAPFYLRQPRSEGLYLALLRRYHPLQPRYLRYHFIYDKEIGKNSPFSITATVSDTENPVTLTVAPETPARHRLGDGDFRDFLTGISKCLTKGVANSPLCGVS